MKRIYLIVIVIIIAMVSLLLVSCGGIDSSAECDHHWVEANCTTPRTCSKCDIQEGTAVGHKWEYANCTRPKICSICGTQDGVSLGHMWNDANCTTPKTCSRCGTQEGVELGHQWVDATCSKPKTCERCNEITGEVADHIYVDDICTMCHQKSPLAIQLEKGQKIYTNLDRIAHENSDISRSKLAAWKFSIFEANDEYYLFRVEELIADFSESIGFDESEVRKAIDQYSNKLGFDESNIFRLHMIREFKYSVPIMQIIYENKGTIKEIDSLMEETKKLLDEMASEYGDQTKYDELMELYDNVKKHHDLVRSPSGSLVSWVYDVKEPLDKIKELLETLNLVYIR